MLLETVYTFSYLAYTKIIDLSVLSVCARFHEDTELNESFSNVHWKKKPLVVSMYRHYPDGIKNLRWRNFERFPHLCCLSNNISAYNVCKFHHRIIQHVLALA